MEPSSSMSHSPCLVLVWEYILTVGRRLIQRWDHTSYSIIEPAHEIMAHFILRPTHSSNVHAHPSSGARCLIFGRTLRLLPNFTCVRTAKALARLRGCTGLPEPSLVAYVICTHELAQLYYKIVNGRGNFWVLWSEILFWMTCQQRRKT